MRNYKTTNEAIAACSEFLSPDVIGLFGALVDGVRFEFWFNPYSGWQFNSIR